MARKTPYTLFTALIDVIATLLTAGGWLVIVLVRELYKRQSTRSKPYTVTLAIIDAFATYFSAGLWLIVMLFREMVRRN